MAVDSQASLTEGHAQGVAPMRSFSIQYLTLILIILTFIIGVFAGHRIDSGKRRIERAAPIIQKPIELFPDQIIEDKTAAIGAMDLAAIFEVGTSDLNPVMVDSISEVLLAHDIEANFVVASPGDAINADAALAIALGRSAVLFRGLLERGVPSDAVRVIASDEQSIPVVAVNFIKKPEVR